MKMYELLADPNAWTQRTSAKRKDGFPVAPEDPEAICYCLTGAKRRCYPNELEGDEVMAQVMLALDLLTVRDIEDWNDYRKRSHFEVLTLCRELDI